jgi:predicted Zn finger-like uncharacterized protein
VLTRCPSCATHFRVTPEQLKARAGRVRCGECQNVFNALDSLIEEPVVVPAPAAETAVTPGLTFEESPQSPVNAAGAPASALAEIPELPQAIPAGLPNPETGEVAGEAAAPASAPDAANEPSAEAEDWIITYAEPVPRRWPWVLGSLVAIIALLLQSALAFRVELSIVWPETKPHLVKLCELAGCEVGFPAKIALVGIEASDLHPDSGHKGRLALSATLKNRAPFTQQFPHLELTLTDTADKAIARKVLAPADYLPRRISNADGMAPNADIPIVVGVDSGDMAASGYRLYLFYP